MTTHRDHAGVRVTQEEVQARLPTALEELADEIGGDWGGNVFASRAVILLAYKLGWKDGRNEP